jgi:hypothetical protein
MGTHFNPAYDGILDVLSLVHALPKTLSEGKTLKGLSGMNMHPKPGDRNEPIGTSRLPGSQESDPTTGGAYQGRAAARCLLRIFA